MPADPRYEVLLFDLGGVIVELGGLPVWQRWTGGGDSERIWAQWLHSPAVRRFESGRGTAREFGEEIVRELALPISPAHFLREFESWPRRTYPGALELLANLRSRFRLACLSNCNELHWPRFMGELGLAGAFDHAFSSHELGALKPDREVFELVVGSLNCEPSLILFLDDNRENVDAARSAGLHSHCVQGIAAARARLEELDLLGDGKRCTNGRPPE